MDQLGSGVIFRTADRLFQERQRLEPLRDVLGTVDDLADADDDGNAVRGQGSCSHGRFRTGGP